MSEEQQASEDLASIYADIDAALEEAEIQPQEEATEEPEAEEVAEQPAEESTEEPSEEPAEEVPPSMQKAIDSGWVPKDQFTGDPDTWVDHEEFNRRTPLFETIQSKTKAIKSLEKKVDALINHNKTLEQRTREKVLAELKAEQRKAVEAGDTDAYDEAEKKIDELDKEEGFSLEEEQPEQSEQPEIPQVVKDFAERNTWFDKDPQMTRYTLSTMEAIKSDNPELSLADALSKAEAEVKQVFAHKLNPPNPKKEKPASVMGGSQEKRPTKPKISDLTPEQKSVWYSLKASGMTEDEFLSQLEMTS